MSERGDIAEAAVTLPVVLLVALGLINLAMAGYAAASAHNAANYGARMGSVAQVDPAGTAAAAAWQMCNQTRIGTCSVVAYGGGYRGAPITVVVSWRVPNYFAFLAAMFGGPTREFSGRAVVTFRQEGW